MLASRFTLRDADGASLATQPEVLSVASRCWRWVAAGYGHGFDPGLDG